MTYIMFVLLLALVLGLIAVASNPSPYFAALGLVVVAGAGCGILVGSGGSFLSLILFLIYLGGMLVVFAYSSALAAEPYPETLGSRSVAIYVGCYLLAVVCGSVSLIGGWYEGSWVPCGELSTGGVVYSDMGGVGMIYSEGGWMLVVSAWMLLLCLFVVLELTRGVSRGTLRVV
uniref:NADH-ubiquinone oxidoreductase chain 6 n=1 Tax=Pegasus sinensis TaxID=2925224 RepID=A0AA49K428_9TELE|nr:NADH dehydrogenase subunit 6 [Pegasus sinensis]WKY95831.1 NADH dehydrogenase subunit 6 [Pegasus sinensis]